MLYFMKETKHVNSAILRLSASSTEQFQLQVLPSLLKIVANEAKRDTFNTLDDLLQLLIINDEIVNMGES